jgi:ketosteroid isomerase-like protein
MEEIVRRYLRVFVTKDLDELAAVMDPDVVAHGAGFEVRGRENIEKSLYDDGLETTNIEVTELFAARDRVVVAFIHHLRHIASGEAVIMTGLKMYRLAGGKIVEFWGETDLYGLLRRLGKVPASVSF